MRAASAVSAENGGPSPSYFFLHPAEHEITGLSCGSTPWSAEAMLQPFPNGQAMLAHSIIFVHCMKAIFYISVIQELPTWGMKIPVSAVQFRPSAPKMSFQNGDLEGFSDQASKSFSFKGVPRE